jgi:hypothetical protein
MTWRQIVQLFLNNKIQKMWMKFSFCTFRRLFCVKNLKTVRLFGFRTDFPAWVLTNTKSKHTNRQIVFLFFILLRSVIPTGQKELTQLWKLRRVD